MKQWIKILLYALLPLLVLIAIIYSYSNYENAAKYESAKEKYLHYIGYIEQSTALANTKYELCGDKKIAYTYNGAAYRAYKISKNTFRKNILKTYQNNGYPDSGYLNFRFLVNCKGEAGWFEIIEMNLDLEETELEQNMVDQLFSITSNSNHWNALDYKGSPLNYYMYISYRIENGEIVEILP